MKAWVWGGGRDREKGLKLETLTSEFGLCLLRECHSQLQQSQLFFPTCAGVVFLKGQGHGCINRRNDLLSCGKNYYLLRCSVAVTHISLWGNQPQDIWMEIWGPSLSLALSFLSKCFTLNGFGFREKLQQYTRPQPMSLVHTLFCDSKGWGREEAVPRQSVSILGKRLREKGCGLHVVCFPSFMCWILDLQCDRIKKW